MNQRAQVNQCGQPPKQENKPSNDKLTHNPNGGENNKDKSEMRQKKKQKGY